MKPFLQQTHKQCCAAMRYAASSAAIFFSVIRRCSRDRMCARSPGDTGDALPAAAPSPLQALTDGAGSVGVVGAVSSAAIPSPALFLGPPTCIQTNTCGMFQTNKTGNLSEYTAIAFDNSREHFLLDRSHSGLASDEDVRGGPWPEPQSASVTVHAYVNGAQNSQWV